MVREGSAAGLLSLLPPTLLPSLIPAGGFRTWQQLAALLPLSLSRHLLLECLLTAPDSGPDLHLAVTHGQAAASLPELGFDGDPLLRDFMGRWLDSRQTGGESVGHIWLSFDLAGRELAQPHLYLHSERLAAGTVHSLLSPLLNPGAAAALGRYLDAVPRRPTYAGMVRRPGIIPHSRLIWYMSPADAPQLLQQIGWTGSLKPVTPWLTVIGRLGGRVGLVIDFGARPLPRLGLEFMNSRNYRDRARWSQALGQMVTAGLATREQKEELLNVSGFVPEVGSRPDVLQEEPPQRRRKLFLLERRLSHLKLRIDPLGQMEASVYLSLKYGWLATPKAAAGNR